MSRLGHALIAPLLLALSLGALASGVDTYEFRHPERQTRAQELARALRCCGAAPPSCCCWPSIACAGACIAGNRRGCRLSATEPRGCSPTTPGPN